ncbi:MULTISPECIES: hypothetical protein [unclassified Rhizobium]|uniref:hypothetical protein n=1 Tax=unclassified Rhizobium TaxID=2613769 RepID=UPI0014959C93|nr:MULTISPECIES: hypothetical protein [unclassified Rhizobium]
MKSFTELVGELAALKREGDDTERRLFSALADFEPKLPSEIAQWPEDVSADDPTADEIYDPHEAAPLKLEQAVCLPELGGVLRRSQGRSTPSPVFVVKTLRKAIADGALIAIRPNTKNIFVSRSAIREWLAACQDDTRVPTLSSEKPAATKTGASRIKPSGSSKTETRSVAQDAVSMIVKALR